MNCNVANADGLPEEVGGSCEVDGPQYDDSQSMDD
jgi:hypothetical protein